MAISNSNSEKIYLPCPVTGGVSTRMTLESFIAACRVRMRNRATNCWGHDVAKSIFPQRCNWCKGKKSCWPDELVLTTDVIKTKKRSRRQMTANTNKSGCVCDICGATANNKKNKSRGMTLCSSCKGIVPCVDRLDVVVAMMQRTGKAEELLNKLRPHDDNSDLEVVVRDARETLVKALPSSEALEDAQSLYDIATIAEEAARYIQEQQEKITRLNDDADVHHDDNKSYKLEQEVHRLKRENEYLAQQIKCQSPLDQALLEWARRQYEANKLRIVIGGGGDENN